MKPGGVVPCVVPPPGVGGVVPKVEAGGAAGVVGVVGVVVGVVVVVVSGVVPKEDEAPGADGVLVSVLLLLVPVLEEEDEEPLVGKSWAVAKSSSPPAQRASATTMLCRDRGIGYEEIRRRSKAGQANTGFKKKASLRQGQSRQTAPASTARRRRNSMGRSSFGRV